MDPLGSIFDLWGSIFNVLVSIFDFWAPFSSIQGTIRTIWAPFFTFGTSFWTLWAQFLTFGTILGSILRLLGLFLDHLKLPTYFLCFRLPLLDFFDRWPRRVSWAQPKKSMNQLRCADFFFRQIFRKNNNFQAFLDHLRCHKGLLVSILNIAGSIFDVWGLILEPVAQFLAFGSPF